MITLRIPQSEGYHPMPRSSHCRAGLLLACAVFILSLSLSLTATAEDKPWVVFEGKDGPGKGKNVVFVTGDDEYYSEVGMPLMARILAERYGFTCTVLFAINKTTGVIDTNTLDNIPGLEALDHADAMVLFTRFRALPDDQMKHIIDFIDTGKGIIGLRTATHAFKYDNQPTSYKKYTWNSNEPGFQGGFGRLVLGETWVNHWGSHGHESTRGVFAPDASGSPILRGIKDGEIWCFTDVYEVHLPLLPGSTPLVMGQVLKGPTPNDTPVEGKKNTPMMPVAWTRTYSGPSGKPARVFTSTMFGKMGEHADWDNAALRRLLVNATFWATGIEDKIPAEADVTPIGENPFKKGFKPQDYHP
jgi:type 1 glutamine amidotransferase